MTDERKRLTGAPLRASVQRKLTRGPTARSFSARAKTYAIQALEVLASLSQDASSEAVRVSAANAVLDRAYGKPGSGARPLASVQGAKDWDGPMEVEWFDPER